MSTAELHNLPQKRFRPLVSMDALKAHLGVEPGRYKARLDGSFLSFLQSFPNREDVTDLHRMWSAFTARYKPSEDITEDTFIELVRGLRVRWPIVEPDDGPRYA